MRFLLALAAFPAAAQVLCAVEPRWVVARPGLPLRTSPGGGEPLAYVPFGARLEVTTCGDEPTVRAGGLEGRWLQARSGAERGWAFDAWLVPVPAPPEPCPSPFAWTSAWEPQGPEVIEVAADGAQRRSRDFVGGMRVAWDAAGGELWLPGVALPQAWLAARACVARLPDLAVRGWPPAAPAGARVQADAHALTVRWATGGAPWLALTAEDGGVRVTWRE